MPPSAGVIGWPVAHSKSPLIHRFWLAKLGLDGDYGRFPVAPEQLGAAIRALPALGLRGVNVTVPHKQAVIPFLDWLDPLAERVGAVNTVVVEEGRLVGYNTDVAGFAEPLPMIADAFTDPRMIYMQLAGAGGAARAAIVGAHAKGYVDVEIYNRDEGRARALAAECGLLPDMFAYPLANLRPWSMADGRGRHQALIVNTTALGMSGNPPLHVDLADYGDETIVYDLVYSPLETPLLAAARARGLRTIDGLQMLVAQAAAAFELFFGQPAPREHDAELRALLTAP